MGRMINTKEAAEILGIGTSVRILQLINESCPICGSRSFYKDEKNRSRVKYEYHTPVDGEQQCERCHGTGRRLPYAKRLGKGSKARYLIDIDDLKLVSDRKEGWPCGRARKLTA